MIRYTPQVFQAYPFLFFTGKGGVGKTSTASATAVGLAEAGKKVLLVSTDPASNLQDIFNVDLSEEIVAIQEVDNLFMVNLDPLKSAERYKESVVAPYRGVLPELAIKNMEEQLSGSCTVEVAAFNEFTNLLSNKTLVETYDHVIFDTAPTGHTLRMIELPSAWTSFLDNNTSGASCLGQLSGLTENREIYKGAMDVLGDEQKTKMILVSKADEAPMKEAARAAKELKELGVHNLALIMNGLIEEEKPQGVLAAMKEKQEEALGKMPPILTSMETFGIPLRSYAMNSLENILVMLHSEEGQVEEAQEALAHSMDMATLLEEIKKDGTKVLFTMGKGGVGKTTMASAIALYMAKEGLKVHLTTTDPANHLAGILEDESDIRVTAIDQEEELKNYREEVLAKAKGASKEDLDYIEEDLRSPCTEEIAIFRKFAKIVEGSGEDLVIIDTAPTGHTLLLLDSTESYHKEVLRSQGDIPKEVQNLLPRLRNGKETKVLIVALAEPTPFFEAKRLMEDLQRAGISVHAWLLNQVLTGYEEEDVFVKQKQQGELKWIHEVDKLMEGKFATIPWKKESLKGKGLWTLL
ncbi:MAG TPA: arsenical pump-driving ATPase [Clostridiaceae bacterium]|nr:arsenical pump-driving ATPase [Clostridiaceae bacterium]